MKTRACEIELVNKDLFWQMIKFIDIYYNSLVIGTVIKKEEITYTKISNDTVYPWKKKGTLQCMPNIEMVNGSITI